MADAALAASLCAVLAISSFTDVRERIIPDMPLILSAAAAVAVSAGFQPEHLVPRAVAGAGAGGFLLAAAVARPGGMGLGDVKLAAVMGFHMGPAVALALMAGLAAGAIGGAASALVRRVPPAEATVPLAPFLAAGALISEVAKVLPR